MKKFKVIISPKAEQDLKNSRNYYNEQKENLGNEFVADVKTTVKRIEENPLQFPKYKKEIRKANTNRFPFAILFFVKDTLVNIFAIFNFSRNPQNISKRLNENKD